MAIKHLLLLALLGIIVIASPHVAAFQSDELAEDEEEWGLVGGEPGLIKTRASIDKGDLDYRGSVSAGAKARKPAPATSTTPTGVTGDNLLEFTLEHSFGDSEFSLAGTFSARLRTSTNGRQVRWLLILCQWIVWCALLALVIRAWNEMQGMWYSLSAQTICNRRHRWSSNALWVAYDVE